jgi:hypothetical protein
MFSSSLFKASTRNGLRLTRVQPAVYRNFTGKAPAQEPKKDFFQVLEEKKESGVMFSNNRKSSHLYSGIYSEMVSISVLIDFISIIVS